MSLPLWLLGVSGVGVVGAAFAAGIFWSNRMHRRFVTAPSISPQPEKLTEVTSKNSNA